MYESFFGLSDSPFQLSPDPSFFFASKGHRKAQAYLQYGVYQGEGFIVITGEVGAGKTTLVRTLLRELDPGSVVAAQLVSTQLDADDLLRAVAISFGLSVGKAGKAEETVGLELARLGIAQGATNAPHRAAEAVDRPVHVGQVNTRVGVAAGILECIRQRITRGQRGLSRHPVSAPIDVERVDKHRPEAGLEIDEVALLIEVDVHLPGSRIAVGHERRRVGNDSLFEVFLEIGRAHV